MGGDGDSKPVTVDTDTILARLEGFLKAFEWFNHKADHGCTFAVYMMPKAQGIASALAARFKLQPADFQVELLPEFERELRAVFARFLFLFQEPHGDHLVDARGSFSLMQEFGRDRLLDELAGVVRSLSVQAACRVVPSQECGELREWCFQDDVVLELPDRMCLLHFGVSD